MRKREFKPRTDLKCPFCQSQRAPDYKDVDGLRECVTDRGKLIARARTGTCAGHQRRLVRAIKRARHLALLPFITRI